MNRIARFFESDLRKSGIYGEVSKLEAFVGDIHNHCGISYGYGELENAVAFASQQLDFFSVTGHFAWPDIADDPGMMVPEDVQRYHREGFRKLRRNWPHYKSVMDSVETPSFIPFYSYEYHGFATGDYTILCRNTGEDLPPEVEEGKKDERLDDLLRGSVEQQERFLCTPHHIGYRKGYRGINWDRFNHEPFWVNAFDLERVLNTLSDEDLDIFLYSRENRMKQKQIAAVMGLSEAHITRRMRFIEDKIEYDMLDDGERTETQIKAIMQYNRFIRTGKCESFADVFVYDFLLSMPQDVQLRYLYLMRGQQKLIKFCFLWVYEYFSAETKPVQSPKTALNKISYQLYKKHATKLRIWSRQLFIALEIEVNDIVRRFGIRDNSPDEEFIKTVRKAAKAKGMTVAEYRDNLLFPHGREKILARFRKYLKLHPEHAADYKPPVKPTNTATRNFVTRKSK